MKNKLNHFFLVGSILLLLVNFIFVAVPASHAQTSNTWSDPINLSNAGSSTTPQLVVDLEGTIHAIWLDKFDGSKYSKSTDGGKTWSPSSTVKFPFSPETSTLLSSSISGEDNIQSAAPAPVLLATEKGEIYAVWRDKENSLYYSYKSSGLDLSTGWSNRNKLANSVIDFDVVVSSKGMMHIGYISNSSKNTEPSGVYYRQIRATSPSNTFTLYSSQYFRSLKAEDANIHLAYSENGESEAVFVVWDDRPQKRILMAKSFDGGKLWEAISRIHDSEDSSGVELPYNININVVDEKILLLWQYGQPGSQCNLYSQLSNKDANQFEQSENTLIDYTGCPQDNEFITVNEDIAVVSLNLFDDVSFIAWDGSHWSEVNPQNEISSFVNPVSYDSVIFSCKQVSSYNKQLFVIGCDQGKGGDIWFSSRPLGAIDDWFPPSSVWTVPTEMTKVDQKISELVSVSGNENNIHAFWVQSPSPDDTGKVTTIRYAAWNGRNWSGPAVILSDFAGTPLHMKANADSKKRLSLVWVDSKTGDMNFSWAAENRARITSEWALPQYIPSPSQVNSSPDILVDDSGKIIIAYAIPINEQRGIYFVVSDDDGASWTKPVQIFDATAAGWEIVDWPAISLTGDGRLHVLFNQYLSQGELRISQGLYYSQSTNGGATWTNPEAVTEQPVHWSGLVASGKTDLYRLWQEYEQTTFVSFQQISQDSGETWNRPIIISSVETSTSLIGHTQDRAGNLHFIQLVGKDNLNLLSHMWNGSSWISHESKELYIQERGIPSSMTVDISSKGNLLASLIVDYPNSTDKIKNSIFGINKSIGLPEELLTPFPAFIAIAEPTAILNEDMSQIIEMPTQASPDRGLNEMPFSLLNNRNLVGVILVGGLMLFIIFAFRPMAWKKNRQKKDPN